MTESPSGTRLSLLDRLRQTGAGDASAWQEFVGHYGPRIAAWCRHWGLQEADAEDVVQAVLVKLATKMRSFAYKPGGSFRAWLKTLARHAWYDFASDRDRAGSAAGDSRVAEALASLPARDDLEARLVAAFDLECLRAATEHVRARVTAQTWDAFRLTALEGKSAAQAGAELGMPVANVFKAKSNVQRMLRDEVRAIEGSDEP